ncbi:pyrimidine 5'-nucleotidase [Xanthobacter dioxanivorans]|uniref:Pyrimidine 5'-nucleotidase n=1 Tax=Xanthobacter dioxanivorans TaxID=2528964 RepID=A0A974PR20_9HYPH|nr:pyrimidine 5'-nucleotidase [Xanthobacter dioxanivorans]QRG07773.1 pyrimidine 5'-nucleotidase [Xanthobacter dioxanivorans]
MTQDDPTTQASQTATAGIRLRPDIDTFVFDLDDTLYPHSAGLYEQMRLRVVRFIQELTGCEAQAAADLHAHYYARYGTSLIGLQRHHGVHPSDFLGFVHEIDLAAVGPRAELTAALAALPGRRLVFTNGSARHAARLLDHLGIAGLFDAVCDIEACSYIGKPGREAYETLIDRHAVVPARAIMFDDRAVNLAVPHDLGMQTVLIGDHGLAEMPDHAPHVHFRADDLTPVLQAIGAGRRPPSASPDAASTHP